MDEKIILESACEVFLDEHPTAVRGTVVLLDNTIEGQVGTDWLTVPISPEFRDEIDSFYHEVYRQKKLMASSPLMKCCICGQLYLFVKDVEKSEASNEARKILTKDKWPEKVGFCLHCDGNLQDESDYQGLVWVKGTNMYPATEWYDPSEHV